MIVNADGSIRSERRLGRLVLQFLGSGDSIAIAPVHDTVGYIIAEQLKIFHPMSRWFNEGVSGWITWRTVRQADGKLNKLADAVFGVSGRSKQLHDKVNLLAWPQVPFQNRNATDYDPAVEGAHTQYAIELISQLLAKDAASILPRIMGELNYTGGTDTDTVACGRCGTRTRTRSCNDFKSELVTFSNRIAGIIKPNS